MKKLFHNILLFGEVVGTVQEVEMRHLYVCPAFLYWPADELWGDLADDPCGGAPALLSQRPRVMWQRWRGRGPIVGGAAPVSELSAVEGAATGGATGEAVLLRGANTVRRRRGGGTPRRGAAKWTRGNGESENLEAIVLLNDGARIRPLTWL